MKNRLSVLPLIVALILFSSGCGGGDQMTTAPVSGTVTCNGKPVTGARITFNPQPKEGASKSNPGRPGSGLTDDQGHYTLTTYEQGDGAIVGEHKVRITFPPKRDEDGVIISQGAGQSFPCAGKAVTKTVKPDDNKIDITF